MPVCDDSTPIKIMTVDELLVPGMKTLREKIEQLVYMRFGTLHKVVEWIGSWVVFATLDDPIGQFSKVVAVCIVQPLNGNLFIHTLCSVPSSTSKGTGCCKKLLANVKSFFSGSKLVLNVEVDNYGALRCYKASGFREIAVPRPGIKTLVYDSKVNKMGR